MEGSYQQMEPAAAAAIGIIYFIIMVVGYIYFAICLMKIAKNWKRKTGC